MIVYISYLMLTSYLETQLTSVGYLKGWEDFQGRQKSYFSAAPIWGMIFILLMNIPKDHYFPITQTLGAPNLLAVVK